MEMLTFLFLTYGFPYVLMFEFIFVYSFVHNLTKQSKLICGWL